MSEKKNTLKQNPEKNEKPVSIPPKPQEIGGQIGPDPTRYGDWEKNGRCTDF